MANYSWRERSRDVIQQVLLEHEAQAALLDKPINKAALLKAISNAYPFGPRQYHPYKQWLDEVKAAREFLQTQRPFREFTWFAQQRMKAKHTPPARRDEVAPGQMSLL